LDTSGFDRLTRALGTPSRRGLSRILGGLLLAAPLGFILDFVDAEARKKKRKKKSRRCKGGKKKCGKQCILNTECCVDEDCPTGGTCENGACLCPSGETACDEICADLVIDGANCGACGIACDTDTCVNGACTCVIAEDCPENCFSCVDRLQGEKACLSTFAGNLACDTDDDCPLGTFCGVSAVGPRCSNPCAG
jgi:hypothetical protein